jgi:LPS sulfotransferase NodH
VSDTPRTDNQVFGAKVMAHEMVNADLARELERENAELQRDKERLDWLMENAICTYYTTWHPKDAEYIANRDELDEAMGGA